MELKQFLLPLTAEERAAFAKVCGCNPHQMSKIAYKDRACSFELAVRIEQASEGKVTCEEVAPQFDWDYLRTRKPNRSRPQRRSA